MDTQKQQIVESLQQANNVLVTVSNNPSVDQLAACIGLTLALNKMKKHATAVFSGTVPPIISFLEPEKTIEKTTDSLRDFIIAIDKAKADKLRYKVEDKFVKIFITPYRTSISDKDLEFSEGDFNVDVVLALGVHKQTDLDQAITAHGRILHDATVICVNTKADVGLGSINLVDTQASSLSEVTVGLLDQLDKSVVDTQIATALLTGIVAETDRFRNAKTTPTTMSCSAELLAAGANQQLVASKLESSPPPAPSIQAKTADSDTQSAAAGKPDDGTLQINHEEEAKKSQEPASLQNNDAHESPKPSQIHIDENGQFHPLDGRNGLGASSTVMPLPPTPAPSPSPLNPFAAPNVTSPTPPTTPAPTPLMPPPTITPGGGLNLPPLSPPSVGLSSGPSTLTPSAAPASPIPPVQQSPLPPLPPTPAPAPSPSPLNPFAAPNVTSPTPPTTPAPTPPVQPSVVTPSIIQPDPNAMRAAQQAEEAELSPLAPTNMPPTIHTEGPHLMMQPPTFGSQLNAGMMPEDEEEVPSGTPMSLPSLEHPTPLLEREPLQPQPTSPSPVGGQTSSMSLPPPPPPKVPSLPVSPTPAEPPIVSAESLSSLERDVASPHLDYIESPIPNLPTSSPSNSSTTPQSSSTDSGSATAAVYDQDADVANARDAINAAFEKGGEADAPALEPMASLNAQPLGGPLHEDEGTDNLPPGLSSSPDSGTPPPPPVPPPLIPPTPS